MADKKISELPLLNSVSGSSIIVPIVHDGTTTKVNLSQIAHYSSQWSAKTGSANIFTGNQTINGNLSVSGRLTVNEVVAQYETSSILFSTGSTKLGDQLTDKHEFTGSTNITGALYYNNVLVTNIDSNTVFKLQQTTASLNTQTGSQDLVNFGISSVTGAINTTTSSFDSVFQRISSTTGSINTTTSSFDLVFRGISSVTGAINTTTSSFDSVFQRISSTTGSINTTTSSFDSVFLGISSVTGAMNTQSSSQDLVNRQISSTTGSINTTTSSFDLVFKGISSVTGAMNTQSSSQNLVNLSISSVTGSLIGITNGLMAFTAALDSTYATDAQLYQLYQATASIHSTTASLNTQTGSQDLVNRGISSVTGSINTTTSSFNNVFLGISSVTGAMNTQSSSQNLVNLGISTFTGSIRSEVGLIEAYTASLKSAAIVSSSQQITNYYKFAETASANTFYGTQTVTGNIVGQADVQANKFVFTDGVVNTNVGGQKILATNTNILYLYSGTSGIYINNQANDTTIAQFTNGGQLTIGGPGNDQNLVFGGTNSSIYWGSGGPARMYYNVGDIKISSNGAADVLTVKNIGGISVSGGITGSIMATNGVISGSQQIIDYNKFALTASANTFYGNQKVKGNLDIDNKVSITGSLIVSSSINQLWAIPDFELYNGLGNVNFRLTPNTGNQFQIQAYGTKAEITQPNEPLRLLSPTLQFVKYDNTATRVEISGSLNVSGSTIQIGNNTLVGNTILSGSIEVSGSSNFRNSLFILTGSTFFTGSHDVKGNTSITGSLNVNGLTTLSGSINIASGSGFYRAGNKLFNFGQFFDTTTQSGSANTAYAMQFNNSDFADGASITNNGSGQPTRITVTNSGIYNIQFSAQLATTATEAVDFTIWLARTGSIVSNSGGEIGIVKGAGGGKAIAAWNYLTQLNAGEYVEIYYSKTTANGQIQYLGTQSTPTRPAIPSVIATITQHA